MTLVMQMQARGSRNDPLLYDMALPLQHIFYPLGFPLELTSNSDEVLEAAEKSWGCFKKMFHEPPIRVRIVVLGDGSTQCPPPPLFRGYSSLVSMVADVSNFGVCDLDRGVCFCWLNNAVAADHDYLRYHFLDGLAVMPIESRHCTAVHAGCVVRNGRGVLLCGDPGAGKSSLCLACLRRGWTFVSDDACYLLRRSNLPMLVGNPHRLRFRESAIRIFPELKQHPLALHGGELKIEVMTKEMPSLPTASTASADFLVFLNRQRKGPAAVARFPKESALRYLEHVVCVGSEQLRREQIQSLYELLAAEIVELRYSDLIDAVQTLESMVDS